MRKLLILALVIFATRLLNAQVTEVETKLKKQNIDSTSGWITGGVFNINFSQMHFSDNWAAGGQSSYSANGMLSLFANYKTKNSSWDNTLDIGYGKLRQDKSTIIKTDDRVEFASKYGKKASKHWYYAALLGFKTQMEDGYNYPDDSTVISSLFSPAYFIGAFGMDFKPSDNLSMFAAPLTGKLTIIADDTLSAHGSFGLDPGKKTRMELGGYVKISYKRNLMENVTLQTKIDLFSNYIDKPENVDISWEVLISMKVNKFVSANISTHLLLDKDVDPDIQFKEVLGVGFSYKF